MKLPSDSTKHTAKFRYVEVGHYVESLNQVIREKHGPKENRQPTLIDIEDVERFADKHDRTGIYTSIFQYDGDNFATATPMGSLCFDFDSSDLENARSETAKVVEHLLSFVPRDAISVYFSGGKGFHIECEAIALNVGSSDDNPGVYRFIADDLKRQLALESIDLVIYDSRRMWRLVNTRHQRTGLFKVECMQLLFGGMGGILEYAKEPHPFEIPEQHFDMKANQWFKEYTYQYEQSRLAPKNTADLFARFLEHGSSNIKHFDDQEKVFDRYKLMKNCPAITSLYDKAKSVHELTHYERLFLCSLLTYTQDAIIFLHEIFSQCHDYNPEISASHIEDWVKRREYEIGGRPFTCAKAKDLGIICSGCDALEPRSKIVHLSDGTYTETGELSSPSPIRFCYTIPKGK